MGTRNPISHGRPVTGFVARRGRSCAPAPRTHWDGPSERSGCTSCCRWWPTTSALSGSPPRSVLQAARRTANTSRSRGCPAGSAPARARAGERSGSCAVPARPRVRMDATGLFVNATIPAASAERAFGTSLANTGRPEPARYTAPTCVSQDPQGRCAASPPASSGLTPSRWSISRRCFIPSRHRGARPICRLPEPLPAARPGLGGGRVHPQRVSQRLRLQHAAGRGHARPGRASRADRDRRLQDQ